jgi:glucose-1-phosphate adenylyltransferase
MKGTSVMIMAGGRGTRLGPLTCHRSKPAVPFGGRYRIIDFVLSNFLNSGYRRIFVLTQFMASSLIKHINRNWRLSGLGEFIEVVPAQMRLGEFWYRGTADAVFQNINLLRDEYAEHVAVFGGDHIYKFAVDQMDRHHRETKADLTVAAFPVPRAEAHQYGVIDVDDQWRIVGFLEKPEQPPAIPGRPDWSLVSMGNYLFRSNVLEDQLTEDANDPDSKHDFGFNIIPRMVQQGAAVNAYDFSHNRIPEGPEEQQPYWRDVGTLESYFDANMELRERLPGLNIYDRSWRIRTAQRDYPPARFVRYCETCPPSVVEDSLICEGSIVTSANVTKAMLGYDCFIHSESTVSESVLLSGCDIGAGAQVHRALLDKNCKVEPGAVIGLDPEADGKRYPFITETGIVALPKGTYVPKEGPIQLAYDMEFMLRKDPALRVQLERLETPYTVSNRDRHSYLSAGPRYQRYGP